MATDHYFEQIMQYVTQLMQRTSELSQEGRLQAALQLGEETLRISRAALGETHPFVPISLSNLGTLYHDVGDYAAAELVTHEAVEKLRSPGIPPQDLGGALHNLATMHVMTGDYEAAEPLYREALGILRTSLGTDHPEVATTLNDLGNLRSSIGDDVEAEGLLRESLDIRRRKQGKRHRNVAQSLSSLGGVLARRGDYRAAEDMYDQALKIDRKVFGRRHEVIANRLINVARLRFEQGDFGSAERMLREALEIRSETLGADHPTISPILGSIALVCVVMERAAEALDLMRRAWEIDDREMGQVFALGSEHRSLVFLALLHGALDRFLTLVITEFRDDREAIGWALDLVLRRKGIWAEALGAQRDAILGGHYPELAPRLQELSTVRMQIAQKTLAGPGPEGTEEHRRRLAEWTAARESLEHELAAAIPEISLQGRLLEADRRAVAQALPSGSALVEFVKFDPFDFRAPWAEAGEGEPARYLAFVVLAGEPDDVRLVDLGEAEAIDRLIAAYRSAITQEDERRGSGGDAASEEAGAGEAESLTGAVFVPLVPFLEGRTRLLLSPDGDLTRLPFEVLPSGGRSLIEDYSMSYVSSGRDVLGFQEPSPVDAAPAMVAADPDFDLTTGTAPSSSAEAADKSGAPDGRRSVDLDRAGLAFNRLKGTRKEGEAVARMLEIAPWVGNEVLETSVKAARSPWIVHLATHGFFLPDQSGDPAHATRGPEAEGPLGPLRGPGMENPLLRSGLALAGANTFLKRGSLPAEAEDGILTAEDVSGLDFLGTELVVLSACETGLGEVRRGEGVFGLRRAFVLAGAKTLVMSLWKVPDKPSADLMKAFYANLETGMGRAEALRDAQLEMAGIYPSPWYWGAFICQGDPGPLAKRGTTPRGQQPKDEAPATPPPSEQETRAEPRVVQAVRACGLAVVVLDSRWTALLGGDRPELVPMELADEPDGAIGGLSMPLPDPPGGYKMDRALGDLLVVTDAAAYLKVVLSDSGSLALVAEVPDEVLTTRLAGALARGLLLFHPMKASDLIDERGLGQRLQAFMFQLSSSIMLTQEQAGEVPGVLEEAGLASTPGPEGTSITRFDPDGPEVIVQPTATDIRLIVRMEGVRWTYDRTGYLSRLVELNREARVAKVALGEGDTVMLQYHVPRLTPGVLRHAGAQLDLLATRVMALERRR